MSRVKIVKEAGAKPTDFENTVAKVRLLRCTRRVGRRNFARVGYCRRAEIGILFFSSGLYGAREELLKWGSTGFFLLLEMRARDAMDSFNAR